MMELTHIYSETAKLPLLLYLFYCSVGLISVYFCDNVNGFTLSD